MSVPVLRDSLSFVATLMHMIYQEPIATEYISNEQTQRFLFEFSLNMFSVLDCSLCVDLCSTETAGVLN